MTGELRADGEAGFVPFYRPSLVACSSHCECQHKAGGRGWRGGPEGVSVRLGHEPLSATIPLCRACSTICATPLSSGSSSHVEHVGKRPQVLADSLDVECNWSAISSQVS